MPSTIDARIEADVQHRECKLDIAHENAGGGGAAAEGAGGGAAEGAGAAGTVGAAAAATVAAAIAAVAVPFSATAGSCEHHEHANTKKVFVIYLAFVFQ